jgi:hypothetical protein
MATKSEYDAAYFTLLRAQEEHTGLLRYREFLEREAARLEEFAGQTRAHAEELPRNLRRPVDSTLRPLLEAIGRRQALVLEEFGRMDERLDAAQAFIEECELEVAELRT